jgi:hypothetical protein
LTATPKHIDVDSLINGFYDEQLLKQKENLSILQKDFKYFFGPKIPASLVISLLDEMTLPFAIDRAKKVISNKVA